MTSSADGVLHRIDLEPPVTAAYCDEIARRLYFVDAAIVDYDLEIEAGALRSIGIEVTDPARGAEIEHEVRLAVTDIVGRTLPKAKVIWRSSHERSPDPALFEELVARGEVDEVGDGQVTLGRRMIALLEWFDDAFARIATEHFDAIEYRYPTLIATNTLESADYFRSFPHFLMFVTRLHNDAQTYRGFEDRFEDGTIDPSVLDLCRNVEYCLPPTMCYHTFEQHRGARLTADEQRVVTAVGKSFRYESRYARTIERLWDFTIREIVFMGSRDFVVAARQEFMERTTSLIDGLGFAGRCEVANDPFFLSADAATKVLTQRLMELKYELQLEIEPGRSIAAASFNFHLDHFGTSFDITQPDGVPISTACVGFGLERVLYAFLAQFGLDESGWPPAVRDAVAR